MASPLAERRIPGRSLNAPTRHSPRRNPRRRCLHRPRRLRPRLQRRRNDARRIVHARSDRHSHARHVHTDGDTHAHSNYHSNTLTNHNGHPWLRHIHGHSDPDNHRDRDALDSHGDADFDGRRELNAKPNRDTPALVISRRTYNEGPSLTERPFVIFTLRPRCYPAAATGSRAGSVAVLWKAYSALAKSTSTWSPSLNSPARMRFDSGFSILRSIRRRSGRAPYTLS
jgi:hypothetical protein